MARILVTAGGSREPIDEVRFIANLSTGGTGMAIAEALAHLGHEVTLLHGQGATRASRPVENEVFSSAEDLKERLQVRLADGAYNAVVMCAAVADYRPDRAHKGKIRSDAKTLTLRLVRNPKILPQLKSFSPAPLTVIGFKLTVHADEAQRGKAVLAQFQTGTVDAVVQNDLAEIRASNIHPFHFYTRKDRKPELIHGASGLAQALAAFVSVRQRRHAGKIVRAHGKA